MTDGGLFGNALLNVDTKAPAAVPELSLESLATAALAIREALEEAKESLSDEHAQLLKEGVPMPLPPPTTLTNHASFDWMDSDFEDVLLNDAIGRGARHHDRCVVTHLTA